MTAFFGVHQITDKHNNLKNNTLHDSSKISIFTYIFPKLQNIRFSERLQSAILTLDCFFLLKHTPSSYGLQSKNTECLVGTGCRKLQYFR